MREALDAAQSADTSAARQAADLAFFGVLIHATRNRALGLLYRWVEQAFGGREHELTGAYDDADAVVAELRAISEAVTAGTPPRPRRRSRHTCRPARCAWSSLSTRLRRVISHELPLRGA